MWLVRENTHCYGAAYVLDEHAREIAFCQTSKDAEMLCKLQADRKALLDALHFVQDHCTLYGASDAAREKIDAAIAQAEKEG